MLISADEVIDALGGTVATARLVGLRKTAVSNWRDRGVIPSQYFVILSGELAVRGLAFDRAVFGFKAGLVA